MTYRPGGVPGGLRIGSGEQPQLTIVASQGSGHGGAPLHHGGLVSVGKGSFPSALGWKGRASNTCCLGTFFLKDRKDTRWSGLGPILMTSP